MLLLQSHTKQQLERFLAQPTHGVLLCGPEGTGKMSVAQYLSAELLGTTPEKLAGQPYFKSIPPDDGSLKIEQVRELQKFLQLKTLGTGKIRRVIILQDAHLMTNEAQNALLKSLEEPPADTVIILTAPASQQIKETIYSRVQRINILPVDKQQALGHFAGDFPQPDVEKAYMMSGGHVGLMSALLHDSDHQLAAEIIRAKELLGATRYERLARVEEISKQKEQVPMFLQACKLICSTALSAAAAKGSKDQVKRWHAALEAVYHAEASLPRNPNSKLLVTDLMLNL